MTHQLTPQPVYPRVRRSSCCRCRYQVAELPGLITPMDCSTLAVIYLETRPCIGSTDISYVILQNPLLEEPPVQLQSQPACPLPSVWSRSLQHDPSQLPVIRNRALSTQSMVRFRRIMVPLQEVRVDVKILKIHLQQLARKRLGLK